MKFERLQIKVEQTLGFHTTDSSNKSTTHIDEDKTLQED